MGDRDLLRPVLLSDFEAQVHFAQVSAKSCLPCVICCLMIMTRHSFEGFHTCLLVL